MTPTKKSVFLVKLHHNFKIMSMVSSCGYYASKTIKRWQDLKCLTIQWNLSRICTWKRELFMKHNLQTNNSLNLKYFEERFPVNKIWMQIDIEEI